MLGGAILLAGLIGCFSTEEPALPPSAVELGWISTITRDSTQFSALMEEHGRDGWVQLHAHDDSRATATFGRDPVLRARPAWKVAMVEQDLANLAGIAHAKLFETWSDRDDLPPGGAAIAAWSAWCSDGDADAWIARVPSDDPGAGLTALLQTPPDQWPEPQTEMARRMAAHHAALSGDPKAEWDRPKQPVLSVEGDVPRTWYDPCFHQVASAHARRVVAPDGWEAAGSQWAKSELAGSLFGAWLTADDLAAEIEAGSAVGTWGANAAHRHGLTEITGLPADDDNAQEAREHARIVADRLAVHLRSLEAGAEPNGQALLIDLRLGEHWRQQWHLAIARAALDAGRPKQALAYAELGTDFSNEAGPQNPDGLYAVRANALLQLGRTGEALDALHGIDDVRGVRQLAEVVGDLAVLEGLDRAGDSKEN